MYLNRIVSTTAVMLSLAAVAAPVSAQDAPLTPSSLRTALAANPTGAAAGTLADEIRHYFGKRIADNGAVKLDDLNAAWAIETTGAAPKVVSRTDSFQLPLQRVGETNVYAASVALPEGTAMHWVFDVGGKQMGGGNLEAYTTPPEAKEQPGIPKGQVIQQPKWKSTIFAGTERNWWIYVPAQYKPENPAAVMIFQDGGGYYDYTSRVFDNLIAKGEMPVTIGIFINPGTFTEGGRSDRSFEYDTLSYQYSRFLLEEILPEVEKTYKLRQDAAGRAIAGASSGGICAFTAAWQRPDQFSKVLSWVGSFTNLATGKTGHDGGHNYEAMIRRRPAKPIRVFLQDGRNDLDNVAGDWPLAAQQMAKALAFAKYDYKFVFGNGFHSPFQGRAIMPDSLRWLWRP